MMTKIISGILLAQLTLSALCGCAVVNSRKDHVNSNFDLQVQVVKNILSLREQANVKNRIKADPILAEQEKILVCGLESILKSHETILKSNLVPNLKKE